MTRIADLLGAGPTVSFEFFPPKTDEGRAQLATCVDELAAIDPTVGAVTYGAGGTVRDATHDLVVAIDRERRFPAMPHLTCIGHTRAELSGLLDDYADVGDDERAFTYVGSEADGDIDGTGDAPNRWAP